MSDVLLLSLGTTLGWRAADAQFADGLRRAGASVAAASVRMGATGRLRRAYPVTDLVEAVAARRALRAAIDGRATARARDLARRPRRCWPTRRACPTRSGSTPPLG